MNAFYKLYVPSQAVGANAIYFDLWNAAGSGLIVYVYHIIPIISGDVAVTSTLAVDVHLLRTSAIGTSGTAATAEGTDITALTFSAFNHNQPMDLAKISARLTPTGGATSGGNLNWRSPFTEESNAGAYTVQPDLVRSGYADYPPLQIVPGAGIKVIQGAVASAGNIGFDVMIRLARHS